MTTFCIQGHGSGRYGLVALAAAALLWAGCGGTQTAASGEEAPSSQAERAERRAAAAEPELSPEEIAAREAAAAEEHARAAFSSAVRQYAEGVPGQRDLRAIRRQLLEVLEVFPDHAPTLFNLGLIAQEEGDLDEARARYQAATDADQSFARGMANLGALELAAGHVQAAIDLFEACLERHELEAGCNINLSLLHQQEAFGEGRMDRAVAQQAIDRLRFALGGESLNAEAYANLARIYYNLGRYELARLVCVDAYELGIQAPQLFNQRGMIALAQNDVVLAYQMFQEAANRNPRYVDALMNIGTMALSFRDYEAAHHALSVVLEEEPDRLDARLAYGVSLRGLERFDDAEAAYNQVLASEPGHAAALFNLAVLFQEYHQDYPRAVAYYRQFLEAAPADHERRSDAMQRVEVLEELIEILGGQASR